MSKREERADIEAALETAVERGARIARFRERTGHNGRDDKPSFGALKHAETKMQVASLTRRLQVAYERQGVGSDQFKGALHEYLGLLNATWYQDSHAALSEHRDDLVTDLYLKMIDPANSTSGASIYRFEGRAPVHHFVNSVFKMFFMETERTQKDYDFKHFRLVDDSSPTSPRGDIRAGQVGKLALPTPADAQLERDCEEQEQKRRVDLSRTFGRGAKEFAAQFQARSDTHLAVLSMLHGDPTMSATEITRVIRTDKINIYSFGELVKVVGPLEEVHERTIQRIKKEFFDGLREIAENNYETTDPELLAKKVWRSVVKRAGAGKHKPVRRHPVETKKSRAEAQKADPNYVEKTFPNDGPQFGSSRKRTNMDSNFDKNKF